MSANFRSAARRGYPQQAPSIIAPTIVISVNAHVRRRDRYSVSIEDSASVQMKLTLSDEFVFKRSVREGDELDESRTNELLEAASRCTAFDRAMAALAVRGRSIRELERWLAQRGVPAAHAAEAVARLRDLGLLDDTRFASDYVRARVTGRGASVWSLRRDLARKGIAREIADAAIGDILADTGTDDLAMARREAERKWRTLARVEESVARRRLMAFLQRRGFSIGVAIDVIRELLRERGSIV